MSVQTEYNPMVSRRQLASRLRELREAAGKSPEAAAQHLDCSTAKISRIENARVPLRAPDVRSLLDLYAASQKVRSSTLELLERSQRVPWWQEYMATMPESVQIPFLGLEDSAQTISTYETIILPGLVQTRAYAHAVHQQRAFLSDSQVDRLVELRMLRQRVLTREQPTLLYSVLGEGALRNQVGGPVVMREQLAHLITIMESPTVRTQILPFAAGKALSISPFIMFGFTDTALQDAVFSEYLQGGYCEYRQDKVAEYSDIFDDLSAAALDEAASIDMVQAILKEFG